MVFEILSYSFSSLIWGTLISAACMSLFIFLIKGWYKDATFSPISYIVGIILFFFLSFQCVLIVGSLKIISMIDVYEQQVASLVESFPSNEEISKSQASDVVDAIINEFPILEYYIGGGEFTGYTAGELPSAIAQELRTFMHWYIIRRLLWCLGFVIVGATCVIKSLSQSYTPLRHREIPHRQQVQTERRRVYRRQRR